MKTTSILFLTCCMALLAVPSQAQPVCYEVDGQIWTVGTDTAGTLASYGIFNGAPVFGTVEFDQNGVGFVKLGLGTAPGVIVADTNVATNLDTLYLYSLNWAFNTPYTFTYGDVRFEGEPGWLASGIPADLDKAKYGWGHFQFSDPAGPDMVEFDIYLPTFTQAPCNP